MNRPAQFEQEFATFPAALRALVDAELKAGNAIVALQHGFPAAPRGASIMLAQPVGTDRRRSANGVEFCERNNYWCAGEFTTSERYFFVLEPPLPPPPDPDMNAIRAAMEARERAGNAERPLDVTERDYSAEPHLRVDGRSPLPPRPKPAASPASPAVERFRESMTATYERWHDGIGYDLEIVRTATPKDLVSIEDILLSHGANDWRDVEALAELNSPRARVALQRAHKSSNQEVRLAVQRYAPSLVTDDDRIATLVGTLRNAEAYGGLTQALLDIETFHPPEIINALLRGLMERDGGTACHFAAMLYFLHGKAASAFDWDLRPFFLRFNTEDMAEREAVVRELCGTIGVDPGRCLKPTR